MDVDIADIGPRKAARSLHRSAWQCSHVSIIDPSLRRLESWLSCTNHAAVASLWLIMPVGFTYRARTGAGTGSSSRRSCTAWRSSAWAAVTFDTYIGDVRERRDPRLEAIASSFSSK